MKKAILSGVLAVTLILQGALFAQAKTPNDTFYNKQWYLERINAPAGWDKTTGSNRVVVAVIDTRVDIDHEDLRENIWVNKDEIAGNGLDDDQNGYIDDVHGWNFLTDSHDVAPHQENNISDEAYVHGTLVSSIIGARGNNGIGITGVAWNVSIMPIVTLDEEGGGNTTEVSNAVRYAIENGAHIINMSIEGFLRDPALDEAIALARSRGILTVTASGNGTIVDGTNLDVTSVFPACLSSEGFYGLLSVGGTDGMDLKAPYSNFGSCVDVSAPGYDIFAARPIITNPAGGIIEPGYSGGWSGTSLAAPLVSGLAALIKSEHPSWGAAELKEQIRRSVVPIDPLNKRQFQNGLGTGRIDVGLALQDSDAPVTFENLELHGSTPGRVTKIQIWSDLEIIEVLPYGTTDTRGAQTAFSDVDGDGVPEIIVAPASGNKIDWVVIGRDGQELYRSVLPVEFTNGALVAGVDGGFVIADPNGGEAYGIGPEYKTYRFTPYGERYRAGMDLLAVSGAAAFAPRNGGGHLTITDYRGKRLVNVFPFGAHIMGRWSLARIIHNRIESLVMSGPPGSLMLDAKKLGNIGWESVSFSELEHSRILTSSGESTGESTMKRYDTWPHS